MRSWKYFLILTTAWLLLAACGKTEGTTPSPLVSTSVASQTPARTAPATEGRHTTGTPTASGTDQTPTASPSPTLAATLTATPTSSQPSWFIRVLIPPPRPITPAYYVPPLTPPPTEIPSPMPIITDEQTHTFLLLGIDRRGRVFRTDAIVLVAIRPYDGTVSVISFPRDLYVYVPSWTMERLNAAYAWGEYAGYPGGGRALMRRTFLYNFGIRVDHILLVDFESFKAIVDALGGIEVPVSCPYTDWRLKSPDLDPTDPENWELYTVEPGLVPMDGDMALWYVRARSKSSDYHRHRRQQEVLLAIYRKAMANWHRLPAVYQAVRPYVDSRLTWHDVLPYFALLPNLDLDDIRLYRIRPPVVDSWRTPRGHWVLLWKRLPMYYLLKEALGPPPDTVAETGPLVAVRNASGKRGWDLLAAWRLEYWGYETLLLEPTTAIQAQSRLYPLQATKGDPDLLLHRLGLAPETLVEGQDPPLEQNLEADWLLIIGQDYNTCFDPSAR